MRIPSLPTTAASAVNWLCGKRQPTTSERLVNGVAAVAKVAFYTLVAAFTAHYAALAFVFGTLYVGLYLDMAASLAPAFLATPMRQCAIALVHVSFAVITICETIFSKMHR